MPNRILKDSIKYSDQIDSLTWFEEVVFYRLMVSADDYGCYDGRINILKNALFPTKDSVTKKSVEDAISHLASVGLLCLYTVNGKPYLFFPTWEKHQRVRNKERKYPEPPESLTADCCQLSASCCQLTADCQPESNPIQIQSESESKTEKGACPRFSPPSPQEVDDYCREKGYQGVDGQVFCDYYASKGWKVGQTAMKDWRAAGRTWGRRRAQEGGNGQHGTPHAENRGQPALDVSKLKYREGLV